MGNPVEIMELLQYGRAVEWNCGGICLTEEVRNVSRLLIVKQDRASIVFGKDVVGKEGVTES